MRIIGDVSRITGIYDKQTNVNRVSKPSSIASKRDVASISNTAKDFQSVLKAIKDVPDTRQDKVDELSKKYENGSYNTAGGDIANKIISSLNFNTKI